MNHWTDGGWSWVKHIAKMYQSVTITQFLKMLLCHCHSTFLWYCWLRFWPGGGWIHYAPHCNKKWSTFWHLMRLMWPSLYVETLEIFTVMSTVLFPDNTHELGKHRDSFTFAFPLLMNPNFTTCNDLWGDIWTILNSLYKSMAHTKSVFLLLLLLLLPFFFFLPPPPPNL